MSYVSNICITTESGEKMQEIKSVQVIANQGIVNDRYFKDYDENKKFYDNKINTAKFYFDKVLPRAEQHYKSAISGSSNIMNFKFN